MGRPLVARKLLVASIGVATFAYACGSGENFVGNCCPPLEDAGSQGPYDGNVPVLPVLLTDSATEAAADGSAPGDASDAGSSLDATEAGDVAGDAAGDAPADAPMDSPADAPDAD